VAAECAKRPHVCQYCSFRATYEEVVHVHVAQCKYVPLDCPNRCGVTFERDFLQDHMKMCRLEEVTCEFRGVGCDGRFLREDQENHVRENSDKHLTLTAALTVETKDDLLQKLLDQDKSHKEEEHKLREKIEEQVSQVMETTNNLFKKLQDQDEMHKQEEQKLKERIEEQQQLLTGQQQLLAEQEEKMNKTEEENLRLRQQFQDLEKKLMTIELNTKSLEKLLYAAGMKHSFVMANFSKEKLKDEPDDWKSPAMYTHNRGYKFCIGVDAYGSGFGRIRVNLWAIPGEDDHLLKWPARVKFTVELVNQQGEENAACSSTGKWTKPSKCMYVCQFNRITYQSFSFGFIRHSDIPMYTTKDSLHFHISEIVVL